MAANVLSVEDAREANIDVIENGRGTQAVHDLVTAMRANRRSGTANTKTRGEVSATNAKPWRQKGTGRARAGRSSSPIWRGGGVVFGPRPRSYAKSVNKRTRRLAFRKALSSKILAGDILLVDDFEVADGKTKSYIAAVREMTDARKVLVVSDQFTPQTYLAGRNVPAHLRITADELNVEQLLHFDKIIVTREALKTLAERSAH